MGPQIFRKDGSLGFGDTEAPQLREWLIWPYDMTFLYSENVGRAGIAVQSVALFVGIF